MYKNKVAIVTGAASGIGFAIAKKCSEFKMNVFLVDVEENALFSAEDKLKKITNVSSILADVSKTKDVEMAANVVYDEFPAVHFIFNNAGVGVPGNLWEKTLNDWKWVLGVNLGGVINATKSFIPLMLKQDEDSHFINTASGYGLFPSSGIYGLSKSAIITLSEILDQQLKYIKSKIKVHILIQM